MGLQLTWEWSPAEGSSEQLAKVLSLRVDTDAREATNIKTMDSVAWLVRLGQKPNPLNADRSGEGETSREWRKDLCSANPPKTFP